MAALTNFAENRIIDGLLRGGAMTSGGVVNSTAVVKGIWTASAPYVIGDIVVPHANMTGAGGKLLRCTVAGNAGATNTLACPAVGSTLVDGGVTWTSISVMPANNIVYVGLMTTSSSDTGPGTEVSGNAYQRVAVDCNTTAWAKTDGATQTGPSTGVSGTTSNNAAVNFPTPSAGWGTVSAFGIWDNLTGGNLLIYADLTASKVINTSDVVSFPISSLTFQLDN